MPSSQVLDSSAKYADFLGDAGPGQTWSHYADFLHALAPQEIQPESIASQQLS